MKYYLPAVSLCIFQTWAAFAQSVERPPQAIQQRFVLPFLRSSSAGPLTAGHRNKEGPGRVSGTGALGCISLQPPHERAEAAYLMAATAQPLSRETNPGLLYGFHS